MPRNYPRALNPIPSQMNTYITTTFIFCRLNVKPTMTTNLESDSMITSNSSSCNALRATSWWQYKPDANQPQVVRTRWSLRVSRPLLLSTKSSPKSLVTWDARNDRSCEAGGGRKGKWMHCDVATGQGLSFIAGLDHNWNLRNDVDGLTITNYRCKPAETHILLFAQRFIMISWEVPPLPQFSNLTSTQLQYS